MSVVKHLPTYRQKRVKYCGAPMPVLVREDGTRIEGARYRCTDRYCPTCALSRSRRVYRCILEKLKSAGGTVDASQARMVTLTIRLQKGLDGADLKGHEREKRIYQPGEPANEFVPGAIDRLSAVQNECHNRLRRHDYCMERIAHHAEGWKWKKVAWWRREAAYQVPRIREKIGGKSDASRFEHEHTGYKASTGGKTTYIWSREITTGRKGEGWHVHAHYLVPSEGDAVRLVAAWLAAARAQGIEASAKAQYISSPKRATHDSGEDGESCRSAARYITHYMSKDEVGQWSEDTIRAYIYGTHGLRQYDAGGRWRPLGIGKKKDEDASPVTKIAYPEYSFSQSGEAMVSEKTEQFQAFMQGRSTFWQEYYAAGGGQSGENGPLNKYRTNLTKIDLVELSAYRSIKNSHIATKMATWAGVLTKIEKKMEPENQEIKRI